MNAPTAQVLFPFVQRWRDGRSRFRPAHEVINPRDFDVAAIPEAEAKAFVLQHHYAGSYPAARFRLGMFRHADQRLVGVAVFSVPVRDEVITNVFPGDPMEATELGRFVLLDKGTHGEAGVAGNGESWFIARCFEQLRQEGLRGVVSFSDPMARSTTAGELVTPGHVGVIYQATNAVYLGQAKPGKLLLLPNARAFSARALAKIKHGEPGWRYAVEQLVSAGAPPLEGEPAAWLERALATTTRAVRHPGNHKYAWALQGKAARVLPASLPYPRRAA